jgi:hypothetical protein
MTIKQFEFCKPLLKREFDVKEILVFLQRYNFRFWSWGSKNFSNVMDKGLLFKVNGHHHKGYILITLDWSDTFDVHIINTRGKVLDTYTEVYIDRLFETIDNRIEKIKEYHI